ncbi:hypothetical protein B4U80_14129 [Leptotrombidium deliense]|uniref:F-box domain-containing protein n=1 Tax=Leptotrombidium deliense TaxID=299467 RepID=A0A443S260_9ACAR|nr:hypothetical protein B4U80_14129 [Leptotrombidium deliense]
MELFKRVTDLFQIWLNTKQISQNVDSEYIVSPIHTFNEDTFEIFGDNLSPEELLNLRAVSPWMKSMVDNFCAHKRDLVVYREMTEEHIKFLGSLYHSVVSLRIKDAKFDNIADFFPQHTGNYHSYNAFRSVFTDVCIHFKGIQTLHVDCFPAQDRVQFPMALKNWPDLKHLHLQYVDLDPIHLKQIVPQLESIFLKTSLIIKNDKLLENAQKLKQFKYCDWRYSFALNIHQGSVLHTLNVKSITIHSKINIDDTHLSSFKAAESLCLHIYNLNDSQLSSLLSKTSHLKYLTLNVGANDYFLVTKSFINALTKITSLQKFTLKDKDCARIKYVSRKFGNAIILSY